MRNEETFLSQTEFFCTWRLSYVMRQGIMWDAEAWRMFRVKVVAVWIHAVFLSAKARCLLSRWVRSGFLGGWWWIEDCSCFLPSSWQPKVQRPQVKSTHSMSSFNIFSYSWLFFMVVLQWSLAIPCWICVNFCVKICAWWWRSKVMADLPDQLKPHQPVGALQIILFCWGIKIFKITSLQLERASVNHCRTEKRSIYLSIYLLNSINLSIYLFIYL